MGKEESDLLARIQAIEKEHFPEMEGVTAIDASSCGHPNSNWMYFSPEHYYHRSVLTNDFIDKVSAEGLLSVGAGPGYLEQTLVHLGVQKEKIVLTDIEETMPAGFTRYVFDMHEQWPVIGNFGVVLLPQSNLHDFDRDMNSEQQIRRYQRLFRRALRHTNARGELIIVDGELPFKDIIDDAMETIRRTYPDAGYEYSNEHVLRLFPVASLRKET